MPDLISLVHQQLLATSAWELLAVLLAIAYLLLAMRENSLCWYCALISTAIYTALFWDVSLLMESALNVYYMAMAIYGWHHWRQGSASDASQGIRAVDRLDDPVDDGVNDHIDGHDPYLTGNDIDTRAQASLAISTWPLRQHLLAWSLILVLSLISGTLLLSNTSAVLPYIDSFTTWGSVLTTWMVARKILENWLYWIIIDGVSIFLYVDRGLYLTSLLFVAYVIIVVFAYFSWRKKMAAYKPREIDHVIV